MIFEEIQQHIEQELGEGIIFETDLVATPNAIVIEKKDLLKLFEFLHTNDQLYFDSLSCLTALDNGPEINKLEMVYNLYSIPFNHHLMVKVTLDRENPVIDSVTKIWKTADWHEREAFDLMGVQFLGHEDLRRILMPADWEGYPLRKDYKEQTYYRGVKVKY